MQSDRREVLKALALLAAPGWAGSNSLLRLPYLQCVQTDRASVLWTTASPGTGVVTVNGDSGAVKTVKASMRAFSPAETNQSSPFYQFRADITGLQPGTTYTYRVAMDGFDAAMVNAGQYRFRTAANGKFSFLAFGDTGENSEPQRQIMTAMNAEPNVAMAIHTGDLAYPLGSFSNYESAYFGMNASRMASLVLFPTPGNHDYVGDSGAAYLSSHAPPDCNTPAEDEGRYYSYDWGDAHFVSLDSNLLPYEDAAGRMLAWLRRDLAATTKYWKIVYFHHPPYPTGHHRNDPFSAIARERVLSILERAGVQLVIGGHEHGYERTRPLRSGEIVDDGPSTTYVITGGGGAGLQDLGFLPQTAIAIAQHHYMRVDVEGAKLTGRAIDATGVELDRFQLSPLPEILPNGVVNGGDFTPSIAPGSLATIFGHNFALREQSAGDSDPVELAGITLRIAGILSPLFFASPSQINFQVPDSVSGAIEVELTTTNGVAKAKLNLAGCAPAIVSIRPRDAQSVTAFVTGLGAYASELSVWLGDDLVPERRFQTTAIGRGIYRIEIGPLDLPAGTYSLRVAARNSLSRPVTFAIG
ncbi:MAG: metallophosphoesterase [Acidobacteria bacterium]|nr:metallophosphoesterase [Acidobacteriota bacterium]